MRWLAACFLVLVAAALIIAVAQSSGGAASRTIGTLFDPDLDPKVGEVVELPLRDFEGKTVGTARPGRTLLIAAGTCDSCSSNAATPTDRRLSGFERVIFVYTGRLDEAQRARMKLVPQYVTIIEDIRGELTARLNARWAPRYFVLDADRRVMYIQRSHDETPPFLVNPK